jgi:hypothetical protein
VHAGFARSALRLRAGGLRMRTMFVLYLAVILAGIVFFAVIGLMHN